MAAKSRGRDGHFIYTAWITLRNGRRLHARSVGLRAFKIWVKNRRERKK